VKNLPTLTPKLYAPAGQWALCGATPLVDRSGNGRDLVLNGASLKKRPAYVRSEQDSLTSGNAGPRVADPVFRNVGAFTWTARLWYDGNTLVNVLCDSSYPNGSIPAAAAAAGLPGPTYSTELGNTLWTLGVSDRRLFYYREYGAPFVGNGVGHSTALEPGVWYFCSWRRSSSGAVRIGLDTNYQDFSISPPTGGDVNVLTMGSDSEAPGQVFNGGHEDVNYWTRDLSDSELVPLRKASMGL
jgi:hypothetical protein